jgi:hypothetical protein
MPELFSNQIRQSNNLDIGGENQKNKKFMQREIK